MSPPATIALNVPAGAGRLIQVIVAAKNATTQQMDVYYGDGTHSFSPGIVNVNVAVAKVSSTSKMGNVTGRFLDIDGPLTGYMVGEFIPPNGSPAMEIAGTEMFGGWFSDLFILDGVSFRYTLQPQNKTLFGSIKLDDVAGLVINGVARANNSSLMRVHVPKFYREQASTNMGDPSRFGEEEENFLGLFGGSLGTLNNVCYTSASGSYSSPDLKLFSDSTTIGNFLFYDTSIWLPTKVSRAGGGVAACSGTAFTDHLAWYHANLPRQSQAMFGINGPFRILASGEFSNVTTAGANATIQWSYLPGVFGHSNAIAGVDVLVLNSPTPYSKFFEGRHDGFNAPSACDSLIANGFTVARSSTQAECSTDCTYTYPAYDRNNHFHSVICPYQFTKTGRVYTDSLVRNYKPPCASGSQTFSTSGTFTVPSCISTITVKAWGAGAGGGGAGTSAGGGSGGAGAYGTCSLTVTPNETLNVAVGGAGSGGISGGGAGAPGGGLGQASKIFRSAIVLIAAAGGGGGGGASGSATPGIAGQGGGLAGSLFADGAPGGNGSTGAAGLGGGGGTNEGAGCSFLNASGSTPGNFAELGTLLAPVGSAIGGPGGTANGAGAAGGNGFVHISW